MKASLVFATRNEFLGLSVDTVLRTAEHAYTTRRVDTVDALRDVVRAGNIDLVLLHTSLLSAGWDAAEVASLGRPILSLSTTESAAAQMQGTPDHLDVSDGDRLDLSRLRRTLGDAVESLLLSVPLRRLVPREAPAVPSPRVAMSVRPRDLILIGASTGGPEPLIALLSNLAQASVPVLLGIHMPADQTHVFAAHLSQSTGRTVTEVTHGVIADGINLLRGGANYRIEQGSTGLVLRHSAAPAGPYRPAIDMLFMSAAAAGLVCDAVVLSGIGQDGAEGAAAIEAAGGRIFAQTPASCVVAGMPQATLARCQRAHALSAAAIGTRLAGGSAASRTANAVGDR